MAINHDASTSGTHTSAGTTQTISHTTGALTNGLIKVAVSWDTGTGNVISGVTYNGAALTGLTVSDFALAQKATQIWYRVAPSSGTNNVVITSSGTITAQNAIVSTYSGVDQGSPVGTVANNQAQASDPVTASPNSTADGLVVDSVYSQTGITVGAGQAERGNVEDPVSGFRVAASEQAGTGSPVAMTWDGNTAGNWATSAVNLNAASGTAVTRDPSAGSVPVTGRTLNMGFGIDMPNQAMGIAGKLIELVEIRNTGQILIAPI